MNFVNVLSSPYSSTVMLQKAKREKQRLTMTFEKQTHSYWLHKFLTQFKFVCHVRKKTVSRCHIKTNIPKRTHWHTHTHTWILYMAQSERKFMIAAKTLRTERSYKEHKLRVCIENSLKFLRLHSNEIRFEENEIYVLDERDKCVWNYMYIP